MGANRPLHLPPPLMHRHEGNSSGAHFRTQKQPDHRRFRDGTQTPKIRFWDQTSLLPRRPGSISPTAGWPLAGWGLDTQIVLNQATPVTRGAIATI